MLGGQPQITVINPGQRPNAQPSQGPQGSQPLGPQQLFNVVQSPLFGGLGHGLVPGPLPVPGPAGHNAGRTVVHIFSFI